MPASRLIAVALAVLLLGGCSAQPPAAPKAVIGGVEHSGLFPKAAFGAYPPSPPARRATFRWTSQAPPVRRIERYRDPVGRLSVDLDWPRMVWVEAAAGRGGGNAAPRRVVVGFSAAAKSTVYQADPARMVESVKLSYPWLAVLERPELEAWDWRLLLLRLPLGLTRLIASGKKNGTGKRQFVPGLAFEEGLLAWDERVRSGRGYANRIRAFDCRKGEYRTIAGPGNVHLPSVAEGRIGWNEERTLERGQGVEVRSSLSIKTGARTERNVGTPHAMFISVSEDTVAWVDMRRRFLSQPAKADAYCLIGRKRLATRLTSDGLCSQALAGGGIVAWQNVKGQVLAVDLVNARAYRLAGFGAREATLWDVDGRLVVWELQPKLDDARMERELIVQEIGE